MREMSLDSEEVVPIYASPTFNNLSQKPREITGTKNFRLQPHFNLSITNAER